MRRAALVLVFATVACAKEQPRTDRTNSNAVGASASAVRPASVSADTATPAAARTSARTGDEIVGRIAEQGADRGTYLAIIPASGALVRISGRQIAAIGKVLGADVWAHGRQDADGFVVDTFEVRRVNDRPAEDGIVSVAGTTVTVRTARTTLTYPDAPTALRDAAGARVWITPPVAGQSPSFGIIRAASSKQLRR